MLIFFSFPEIKIGCATVCHPAHGLAAVSLSVLPDIPRNVTVAQWPQQELSATVSMTMARSDVDWRLMLETRTHAGYAFRERKMDQWHEQSYVLLSHQLDGEHLVVSFEVNKLQPGRWYQFRAAAIGIRGTRGYSLPTVEFQLRDSESHEFIIRLYYFCSQEMIHQSLTGIFEVSHNVFAYWVFCVCLTL